MAQVHVMVKLKKEFEFILDATDEDTAEEALLESKEVREKFADACLDSMTIMAETTYDEDEGEDESGGEDDEEATTA